MQYTPANIIKKLVLSAVLAIGMTFALMAFSPEGASACTSNCPQPTPTVYGTCFATPTSVRVGQAVTWQANAAGGTGQFTYSWEGTDGLQNNNSRFTVDYTTPGTKTAIVSITSGNTTIRRSCTVTVTPNNPGCTTQCPPVTPTVYGTCFATPTSVRVGQAVTWQANAAGGNGQFTYSWSGTDGLQNNNSRFTVDYTTPGTKTAIVAITSGTVTIQRSCTVVVAQDTVPALYVSCVANPSQAQVNDTVTYTANATGGNGNYTYSWTGTDGLSGNGNTVSKQYSTSGTKSATVTVTSGNQTRTANCTSYISPVHVPNLTVSCYANPSTANVNDTVQFTANVNGGEGNYQYSWTGTDGLSGNSQTVTKQYGTSGTKSATVTVTSGNQTRTVNCSVYINQTQNQNLYVTCYANPSNININENVNFTANATGGNGNYTYSWIGTDGLSGNGQNVYKSYNYSGTKNATVTVYSGGMSYTANCNVYVQGNNNNPNLNAYCYATPSNINVNGNVTWYANVSGGNGNYQYSWSGTDGLYGYGQSIYRTYNTPGTKYAYLTVTSNGQTVSATCNVNVTGNTYTNVTLTSNYVPPAASGVFLSQVPYTGGELNLKIALFILGLLAWSAFAAYMIISKRNARLASTAGELTTAQRIEAFKKENLARREN